MPCRVLIADDQGLVRAGLRKLLESDAEIDIVGEATDGQQAVDGCVELRPDVVLMDIRMPRLDGIAATERIAGEELARVLVLTAYDLDEYVYRALRAGASGFLLKDSPPERLREAVHVVSGGDALVEPVVLRRLIASFTPPAAHPSAALDVLTARETDVLRQLARGSSNAETAAGLYLSEATVRTHVGRIFAKLGLRDRAQAVVAAYEYGLVVPGER